MKPIPLPAVHASWGKPISRLIKELIIIKMLRGRRTENILLKYFLLSNASDTAAADINRKDNPLVKEMRGNEDQMEVKIIQIPKGRKSSTPLNADCLRFLLQRTSDIRNRYKNGIR